MIVTARIRDFKKSVSGNWNRLFSPSENEGEQILCSPEGSHFPAENKEDYMLQIKNLSIIHKKDLCVILNDFSCVLNDGDKAVIIGEEGNGKSTLLK